MCMKTRFILLASIFAVFFILSSNPFAFVNTDVYSIDRIGLKTKTTSCSLPSSLSIIEDTDESITVQLEYCYRVTFCKPGGGCGETLITNLSVWNGTDWSPNVVEDCGYSEYGLGFLEFYSELTKSWICFNKFPDENIGYELAMNNSEIVIIRFNGTWGGAEGIEYETIWIMKNDQDFIRGFHKKKFNQYMVGRQDQLAEMWEPEVLTNADDKLEITNEIGVLEEQNKVDSGYAPAWNIFTATDLGLMNRFPFMNFYEGESNTSTGMIVLYTQNPEQSKTIDWTFDTMDSKALLEPQIHFFGGSGVSHNPGDENIVDMFYYAGRGNALEVGDKISSEWFSPYYVRHELSNPVKAGEGDSRFNPEDSIANSISLYSIYVRLRNYNSTDTSGQENFDRDWTFYPLGWASKEGSDATDPSNEESAAVFSIDLKVVNDIDTYIKNDTDAEIYNSEYVSWVNDSFSNDGFSGNIKFAVYNNSDKMVVFANTDIGQINAREIFVELDYTKPYTITADRPVSVVKLSDTAYDIRWNDAALGWTGTTVYGVENVEKITDTGSELRVYLLDDVTGHNNENFNITFYIWNHEGIKTLSDITDLHTRAPVYYNQHFIKINKYDDRFGILEFGESAIINETYTSGKDLTMWFWGVKDTQQDYTFYYNTMNYIDKVTVDGVETTWDYDLASKVLTFSVDYSDEVREIIITENTTKPFLPCGDINDDESVTISDIVYLIYYLFKGGEPPLCEPYPACADVNKDTQITISDVIYLINYLLKGGSEPGC